MRWAIGGSRRAGAMALAQTMRHLLLALGRWIPPPSARHLVLLMAAALAVITGPTRCRIDLATAYGKTRTCLAAQLGVDSY